MDVGIIGAGRVGCSIGKYLSQADITIAGYYDNMAEAAESAAQFTSSNNFTNIEDLITHSSLIFITTPDSIILKVWDELRHFPLENKIICHCSGALPSSAFTGIHEAKANGCSIHPMLPFSSRFSSYSQLQHAFFTIEGDEPAVQEVSALFTKIGNTVCQIDSKCKPKYHAAASILSNQVTAVLDTGYRLLEECGFTREEAVHASAGLIQQNIDNILRNDCIQALTGPIERNDLHTVEKHLDCLDGDDREMYQILGRKLIQISEKKNPESDYAKLMAILSSK